MKIENETEVNAWCFCALWILFIHLINGLDNRKSPSPSTSGSSGVTVLLGPREGELGMLGRPRQEGRAVLEGRAARRQRRCSIPSQTGQDQTPSEWLASGVPSSNRLRLVLKTKVTAFTKPITSGLCESWELVPPRVLWKPDSLQPHEKFKKQNRTLPQAFGIRNRWS